MLQTIKSRSLPLLLLLLLPAACQRQTEEVRPTIPLVREILASRSDARSVMLRGLSPKPVSDIAIIGSEFACDRLAEQLSFRDVQDNVDASMVRDGLPDFAGETFACMEDATPYAEVLTNAGEQELRRQTVLRVLAAIDTTVHISPYDLEGLSSKPSSKLVVLADPFLAEYGAFDADTLLRSLSCSVPVVSPLELMIDKAFRESDRKDLSVGIIGEAQYASSGIYEQVFARKAATLGAGAASCAVFGTERRDSVLHDFLRAYGKAGQERPLDVILIDDLSVRPDALKSELAEIVSVMNESSMTLGRMVSRNFFFLNAIDETAACCYGFLRANNLFTHNIAKPQVSVYRPVKRPESADESIILIPGMYVQN